MHTMGSDVSGRRFQVRVHGRRHCGAASGAGDSDTIAIGRLGQQTASLP
jgi:hypothetical protein